MNLIEKLCGVLSIVVFGFAIAMFRGISLNQDHDQRLMLLFFGASLALGLISFGVRLSKNQNDRD